MSEQQPITYKEVIDKLKDKKLEDYTKEDTGERYIVFRYRRRTEHTGNTKIINKTWIYRGTYNFCWYNNRPAGHTRPISKWNIQI